MLAGSLGAALFLLALIPGFIYLRNTAPVRRPSEATQLQEAIEMVAVGLLTTGASIGLSVLVWGSNYIACLRPDLHDTSDLRKAVAAGAGTLVAGCLIALGAGIIRVWVTPKRRYAPNVWESVFGQQCDGKIRHIALELDDGRTFDGPIHAHTVLPGPDGGRQLSLQGPIRISQPGAPNPTSTLYDFVVVDAAKIRFATMTYVDNPSPR